jgi:hypothetical protein
MCFKKKVKYVETYRGWIIAEFKEGWVKKQPLYVAVNPNGTLPFVITGVDLPDLRADIDESMR